MEPRSQLNLEELLDVIRRSRGGRIGDIDYEIGKDGINGQMQTGDATIRALLGYDGNMALNVNKPLWGGQLGLDASKNDEGNKRLMLKYRKTF